MNSNSSNFFKFNSTNQDLNLFGMKIHKDDLMILSLLFFLYHEKSDDFYLYIILLMLLFN